MMAPSLGQFCLLVAMVAAAERESAGSSAACPVVCTCSNSDEASVRCENQELSQLPKIPLQTVSLSLVGNSFAELDTEAFDGLARLQRLDLGSCGLHTFVAAHLRPLRSLRTLSLANNLLTSLSDDMLRPVARTLEELDLSSNGALVRQGIQAADIGLALRPLSALRSLRIDRIGLRDIAGITRQLVRTTDTLEELVASDNDLSSLDPQSLDGLAAHTRLRRVSLANNNIRIIRPQSFAYLTSISDLDISGNSVTASDLTRTITELAELDKLLRLALARMNISRLSGLFDAPAALPIAQRLISLDLAGNAIADTGNRRFYAMKSLQMLDLSDNQIRSLDGNSFSGLTALTRLSLAGNRLHTVTPQVFENLQTLTVLDLSRNQLSTLDASSFVSLFNLQDLDLSRNYITTIAPDAGKGSLEMLQELNLAANQISRGLPELLAALGRLRMLDISRNRLSSLPSGLMPVHSMLNALNLSHNAINDVSSSAFAGSALRVLDLSHNRLTRFPALRKGSLIASLSLRGNTLTTIGPRALAAVAELRELDLGDNGLRELDAAALAGATNLRVLRLDGNELGVFLSAADSSSAAAAALAGGQSESPLEGLDLSGNQMYAIADGLFSNLTNLLWLNMSGNHLSHVTARQLRGPELSLTLLDLSSNNFSRVDPSAFARLATLTGVDLSWNPHACDDSCHTHLFRAWADSGSLGGDVLHFAAASTRPVRVIGYRARGRYACSSARSAGTPLHALPSQPGNGCTTTDKPNGDSSSDEKTIILAVIGCTAFVVLVVAAAVFWQHRVRLRKKLHKQQHYEAAYERSSNTGDGGNVKDKAAAQAAYKCPAQPQSSLLRGDGGRMQQPLLHAHAWSRSETPLMQLQGGGCTRMMPLGTGHSSGTAYV